MHDANAVRVRVMRTRARTRPGCDVTRAIPSPRSARAHQAMDGRRRFVEQRAQEVRAEETRRTGEQHVGLARASRKRKPTRHDLRRQRRRRRASVGSRRSRAPSVFPSSMKRHSESMSGCSCTAASDSSIPSSSSIAAVSSTAASESIPSEANGVERSDAGRTHAERRADDRRQAIAKIVARRERSSRAGADATSFRSYRLRLLAGRPAMSGVASTGSATQRAISSSEPSTNPSRHARRRTCRSTSLASRRDDSTLTADSTIPW